MLFIMAMAISDDIIGFLTVYDDKVSIQIVLMRKNINNISDFTVNINGEEYNFIQSQQNNLQFQAPIRSTDLRQISEYFQNSTEQIITVDYKQEKIRIYVKKLIYATSSAEIKISLIYESEKNNSIIVEFPKGTDLSQGQFLSFGSNFHLKGAVRNKIKLSCPDSFVQQNPSTCFDKISGLRDVSDVKIFDTGINIFQFEKTYFTGTNLKIIEHITGESQNNKYTAQQIVMLVCICCLLIIALVLPVVCLKTTGRKDASNRPIASGFGPQRYENNITFYYADKISIEIRTSENVHDNII
ncbi:hypothetical protein SS50377_23809 [Spironucleus salmonicida]|uniref:Transmembrane protein n=1 Tax=Spironucleus salmonicida TaxID=348837 RepID=V6LQG3_9EUKA|nr:hypothetical protein SS50377_23809 [Spironucleus salmonicida]|eukprot:EST46488.1 Hypothetical protein SS50377_13569 [Spironucleus salmonicida]